MQVCHYGAVVGATCWEMVQRVWTDIRSDCNRLAQQIEAGCGSGLNGRIDFGTPGSDNNSEVEKAVGEWT